jgi:hypothetical protein
MFEKTKQKIKEISMSAVELAEKTLGSNTGREKKEMAIKYIISRLPVIAPLKTFIGMLLSSFIDDAIEFAVQVMREGGINGRDE